MKRHRALHWFARVASNAFLACLTVSAAAATPSPADWRDETIYQIITDRFDDGDPSNNTLDANHDPAAGARGHGGDFAGLRRRLGYLRGLGVTAVWVSPVPKNADGEYHGYAASDFTTAARHWGSLAEMQAFVADAKSTGIRTILDVVTNHGGNLIRDNPYLAPPAQYTLQYRNAARQHAPPFTALSNWHAHGSIGNFSDPEQIVGELFGLDDLKTEDPAIRQHLADIYTTWIALLDLDGFRIDTVKHVELGFWQTWTPLIRGNAAAMGKNNFFLFGEVWDGNDYFLGKYTGTKGGGAFALDSVLDYPLYYQTNWVFAQASGGAQAIIDHYALIPAAYDPAAQTRLVTFLDNHDNPRFLSSSFAANRTGRLHAALVFQLTSLGVPCVYYGTEQYFNGGSDPNCREDMFDGQWEFGPSLGNNFDQTAPGYRLIRKLNQLRRDHPALRRGTLTVREVRSSPGIFAYSRVLGGQEVLVAVNTSDSTQTTSAWPTGFAAGTTLVDALNPSVTVLVGAGGVVAGGRSMGGNGFHVFVPAGAMTNMEPEVVSSSIPLGGALSDTTTPLVLTFSEPMNQASVAGAVAVAPAASVTLGWNAAGDRLTIAPITGWPPLTRITVLIGEAATDTAGAALRGGFETEFTTGQPPPGPDDGIDGTIIGDPRWGVPVAVQTVRTGFGNNTDPTPDGNSGGSEADALYLHSDSQYVYVAVAGNLEPNGNAVNFFFDLDGGAGGVTTLHGVGASSPFLSGSQSASGTVMPACMTCDLILQVQAFGPGQQVRLNAFRWNASGQLIFDGQVGALPHTPGAPTAGAFTGIINGIPYGFRLALDNRHTGPVAAGSTAANPTGADAATGIELRIPRPLLGPGPYQVFCGISGATGYWSNQFLPAIPPRTNLAWAPNLGAQGASCMTYMPLPAAVSDWALY
ncbi:MAG: alpha-amylase family glycosyl hydrolase [Candidatus Sumerlaeaceae bacterium]|nr:alpha-amylase family glycosyl hydrolase [Candidatus Sumerlaeaceae bacterium]